jgi:hypothetical protein
MKKNANIFLGIAIGMTIMLILFGVVFLMKQRTERATFLELLKQSCTTKETSDDTGFTTSNKRFKFSFSYPKDFTACSQPEETQILIFKRDRVFAGAPSVAISINQAKAVNESPQTVVSEKATTIGSVPAVHKKIWVSGCMSTSCEMTIYEFTKDGNMFSIWEREHIEGLLDRFTFNE